MFNYYIFFFFHFLELEKEVYFLKKLRLFLSIFQNISFQTLSQVKIIIKIKYLLLKYLANIFSLILEFLRFIYNAEKIIVEIKNIKDKQTKKDKK